MQLHYSSLDRRELVADVYLTRTERTIIRP